MSAHGEVRAPGVSADLYQPALSDIVSAMRRMHVHDVSACARRLHLSGRPKIHSEADRIMWWRLYVRGESIEGIARKYDCWASTVRRELRL